MKYIYIRRNSCVSGHGKDRAIEWQADICRLIDCDFLSVFFKMHIICGCIENGKSVVYYPLWYGCFCIIYKIIGIYAVLLCYENSFVRNRLWQGNVCSCIINCATELSLCSCLCRCLCNSRSFCCLWCLRNCCILLRSLCLLCFLCRCFCRCSFLCRSFCCLRSFCHFCSLLLCRCRRFLCCRLLLLCLIWIGNRCLRFTRLRYFSYCLRILILCFLGVFRQLLSQCSYTALLYDHQSNKKKC